MINRGTVKESTTTASRSKESPTPRQITTPRQRREKNIGEGNDTCLHKNNTDIKNGLFIPPPTATDETPPRLTLSIPLTRLTIESIITCLCETASLRLGTPRFREPIPLTI